MSGPASLLRHDRHARSCVALACLLAAGLAGACSAPDPTPSAIRVTGATETPAPTATETSTPSATPTPTLHPLTIESMRRRSYPGSEVTIKEGLPPGANYSRAIASYLSDGLRINALLTIPFL